MVEKIIVSRDETIHFPWLDHTWVYIHFTQNEITTSPMFQRLLKALLRYGIKETTGQDFKAISFQSYTLFIQHDKDDIIPILKNACEWLLKYVYVNDPTSPKGAFFEEHKALFFALLEDTKKILEEKTYTYYFQRVDGMN